MSGKIVDIPVKFKSSAPVDKLFRIVAFDKKCDHRSGTFLIDDSLDHVTCSLCGEKLNPMWVLTFLAKQETRWHYAHQQYLDEMKRLADRKKTKCRHCGEMTPISDR